MQNISIAQVFSHPHPVRLHPHWQTLSDCYRFRMFFPVLELRLSEIIEQVLLLAWLRSHIVACCVCCSFILPVLPGDILLA